MEGDLVCEIMGEYTLGESVQCKEVYTKGKIFLFALKLTNQKKPIVTYLNCH